MSLTARLSAFFLSALALVLLGFCLALYVLARGYLHRQVDDRLGASLETLAAAAEHEAGGLEWEPSARALTVGESAANDRVRWCVDDGSGRLVDHSPNLAAEDITTTHWLGPPTAEQASFTLDRGEESWRVLRRRVQYDPTKAPADAHAADNEPAKPKYQTLVLTAAVSLVPVQATLQNLALTLLGLSIGLWTAAALLGRWLCRRALAPMTAMAATARAMSVASWDQRLPIPKTGDELEGFSRAFNDLLSRLQEAFERQRRFTGDASHQLRTPLAALLGQIDVILRRDRAPQEYREVLGRVRDQTIRLQQLLEMLLFLARADNEAKLPSLEKLDLACWLEEYMERWSEHPRAADLRLERSAPGPALICVQGPLLGQLLDNLVDNACKYTPAGTPITLRLERASGVVMCTVEDRGSGIPPTDLAHVFEPFYRSTNARRQGYAGVGLGLAVVERIASVFGGTVRAESEPGQGSRFTVCLPEAAQEPVLEEATPVQSAQIV
jgi:heavy metal sensor kinase